MAKRPIFIPTSSKGELFEELMIEFKYYNGFALSQKSKSIASLHESAYKQGYKNILEVSTKSSEVLGVQLSAFNLMIEHKNGICMSIESAFQGSKVFEDGGPYEELYHVDSLSAKRDARLKNSGKLSYFLYEDERWELEPKSAFYDWIYIKALYQNIGKIKEPLLKYEAFSDIEFNPKKSINCQARSCAILVSLLKSTLFEEAMNSSDDFKRVVYDKKLIQQSFDFSY